MFIEDGAERCPEISALFAQSNTSPRIVPFPFGFETSPALADQFDFAEALARKALELVHDMAGLLVDLNMVMRPGLAHAHRRQDRYGLLLIEVLRCQPSFQFPIYGCSFESWPSLRQLESFRILFTGFSDCNSFLRLPISGWECKLPRPNESRLQELANVLRRRQQERRKAEVAATLKTLLSRFAHNHSVDLTALVGPVKAALRAGYYDLASGSESVDVVSSSVQQLKVETDTLAVEPFVKRAVLDEISSLESQWGSAAEVIGQIAASSVFPERDPSFRSAEALEKITAFEKRILELQRG